MRRRWLAMIFSLALTLWSCGDDEVSVSCPGGQCERCTGDEDCDPGTHCHGEEGVCVKDECDGHAGCDGDTYCDADSGLCVGQSCVPGTTICEAGALSVCDEYGTGYGDTITCSSGVCVDGQCGCDSAGDCANGESCIDGSCVCESGEVCANSGICCGDGESCAVSELCDDDGECQTVEQCLPECAGEVCGLQGELCCEGEMPVCGPHGGCVPDCSGYGEVCGEDFTGCCPQGDVCVFGECRTPGEPCDSFADCDFGEYCDHGLGRCLEDEFPEGLVCEMDVDFDPFDVEELWHWEGVEVNGEIYDQVATTPLVADMTGDGTPEVVFSAYGGTITAGVIVVIDGVDGSTIYVNDNLPIRSRSHNAVGVIDGSGPPQIAVATTNGVGVLEDIVSCPEPDDDDDGCVRWSETVNSTGINQAVSLADITGDGKLEVLFVHSVFDGETGEVLASAPQGQVSMSVALDLNGDGQMEILTSGCAYHYEEGESDLQEKWCNSELPGYQTRDNNDRNYVGVGDVMGGERQGRAEVIWVGDGDVFVVSEEDGEILHHFDLPGAVRGGPPVVADFDGDGTAEFGVGGQTCFTVFDLDCLGPEDEDLPGCERPEFPECTPGVDCVVEPCPEVPGGSGDGILWSIEIVDSVTGTGFASAVFDFQGDGRHEVVYGDHCRVFVLDGRTGSPLMTQFASRRANSEMPIVADVDGDGRSNLVFQANNDAFDRDCVDPIADRPDFFPECHGDPQDGPEWCEEGNHGLFALRDVHDAWVSTHSVWNQHAYHITNIDGDLSAPDPWQAPWEEFNTFRAARQGEVPLNSPDVVVSSLQVHAQMCPPDIEIRATIENAGVSAIPEGMPVSLYLFHGSGEGELVETVALDGAISPGGVTTVDFHYEISTNQLNQDLGFQIVANDDGQGGAPIPDCNPDDAAMMVDGVMCTIQL